MTGSFRMKCAGLCAFIAVACLAAAAQPIEELMSQGNSLLQNGAYDQAVTIFRKVLGRDKANFEAQFNLAFAYLNLGRNQNAVQEFQKALGINSKCSECYGNLALAYEAMGNDEKALGALYEAVKANPGNIEARINLATMYANKNRLDNAIAQYKEIIKIDGQNIVAHVNLAKCLLSSGKTAEAKGYLKTALSINPDDADAHYETGNILWKNEGKKDDALAEFQKAVTLEPTSQVYYENLGLLQEEMGKKEEAIETWRKYLVYLDDALKKENIQYRIDRLERGETPTGASEPENLFGQQDRTGSVSALQQEVQRDRQGGANVKMIDTKGVNVESDLEGLDQESDVDVDLQKAMKKKLEENKK